MKNVLKYLALIALVSISSSCVSEDLNEGDETTDVITELSSDQSSELRLAGRVLALVNKERTKRGLSPVTLYQKLTKTARLHSEDMYKKNYFSHKGKNGSTFSQRAIAQGYPNQFYPSSENIAKGQTSDEAVMKSWMNSTGHKKNILDPKNIHMGLGRSATGNYWTQIFGKRK